jgi:isopenicillin N synthase-like dioxygenase
VAVLQRPAALTTEVFTYNQHLRSRRVEGMNQPIQTASFVPVVDLTSDSLEVIQQTISNAARNPGLVFIRGLPMQIDFLAVQRLFDALYQSPELAARLNSLLPPHGVFKLEGKRMGDTAVDDKAVIRLPARVLRTTRGEQLKRDMGEDFEGVTKFFEAVQDQLIPIVLQATSDAISSQVDLWNVHNDGNINCRLIDYHRSLGENRPGARPHRELSTATIIFQDGSEGLEVQSPTGEWCSVPGHETVIIWGRCGQILSGGRIKAAYHRVTSIPSARRNIAVILLSPDEQTILQPLVSVSKSGSSDCWKWNENRSRRWNDSRDIEEHDER